MEISRCRRNFSSVIVAIALLNLTPQLARTAHAQSQSPKTSAAAENEIRAATVLFYDAFNTALKGNLDPMSAVWSHRPDVTDLDADGGRATGWNEVRADFQNMVRLYPEWPHRSAGHADSRRWRHGFLGRHRDRAIAFRRRPDGQVQSARDQHLPARRRPMETDPPSRRQQLHRHARSNALVRRSIPDRSQSAVFTAGIVHVPSRRDGGVSLGQYNRSIRTNLSAGAGSQLDSLALPGFSFCT